MLLRVNGQANEEVQESSLVSREWKNRCPVGYQIQPWLCIHGLKSGEDFSASGSLRFQNVIPIPTLEVKPTISCKTTLMLCKINSKMNEVNDLRRILLVKTKRVFLFIHKLQSICLVVLMHPSYATNLLACFLSYLFLSFPLHKDRYGHSSWFLVFIINSYFFLFFGFPVF